MTDETRQVGATDIQMFFDQLPDVVLILSEDGHLLWANRYAEEVFGLGLEDTIGVSALDFIHPDDLEMAARSFESIQGKRTGNPIEMRVRIGREWRLIELIGRPVPWFAPGAILFSLRDITERRRFEIAHDDVALFRSLLSYSPTVTLLVDPDGRIRASSAALTRQLGLDPESLEGRPLADLVEGGDVATVHDAMVRAAASPPGTSVSAVARLRRYDGTPVPYEMSFVDLRDDGTVGGMVISAHDVTSRMAIEAEMRAALDEGKAANSALRATLESVVDGVLAVDLDRRVLMVNRQFVEMWGLTDEDLAARDDRVLLAGVLDKVDDPVEFMRRVEDLYAHPHVSSQDEVRLRDGRTFQRFSTPQTIDGAVVGRVWGFLDVTAQRMLEGELSAKAFRDNLTGLANRAHFLDFLDHAAARAARAGSRLAVLFLDVDHFKGVNDRFGHASGDVLLREFAERMRECLRASDTASRLGGDEFAVLVEDVGGVEEIVALAERLRACLTAPVIVEAHPIEASVSIGVAIAEPGDAPLLTLRHADVAMYRAKRLGRDRVAIYEPESDRPGAAADPTP